MEGLHQLNHQIYFIDPETGANIQSIESTWRRVKEKYGIKTRGTLIALKNLFDQFFEDMKKNYINVITPR
jgi:hypothetical protein